MIQLSLKVPLLSLLAATLKLNPFLSLACGLARQWLKQERDFYVFLRYWLSVKVITVRETEDEGTIYTTIC